MKVKLKKDVDIHHGQYCLSRMWIVYLVTWMNNQVKMIWFSLVIRPKQGQIRILA